MRVAIVHVFEAFGAQLIDFASPSEERWFMCNAARTVVLDAGVSNFLRAELFHLTGEDGKVFVANELFVHTLLFFEDQVGDEVDLLFLNVEVGPEPFLNDLDVVMRFSGAQDQILSSCS